MTPMQETPVAYINEGAPLFDVSQVYWRLEIRIKKESKLRFDQELVFSRNYKTRKNAERAAKRELAKLSQVAD